MVNHTKLTQEKREQFIDCIRDTGNVTWAARLIGMSRAYMYEIKEKDSVFAETWENAFNEFLDTVEAEVKRRAIDGIIKPVFYKGERVDNDQVREYSDNLLMFYMKRHRKEFRDSSKVEVDVPEDTARFVMNIGVGRKIELLE